jgi:hypothetical protein
MWSIFSKQDKTWAEFSTLEVAALAPCTYAGKKQKLPILKLKTQPKQVLGYLQLHFVLLEPW